MDDAKKPSEELREEREFQRRYWDRLYSEAKAGSSLHDAIGVIVALHRSLVDGEPLNEEWARWVEEWLHLADRVEADMDTWLNMVFSDNVEHIRSRKKQD